MATLNLGILAHVDAGKTSLTERLLYAAGVIDEPGSVDDGSTRTDTMELERARGITIRSAVVSFAVGGVTVNLIDTPGHPDFIAEVERALGVLDGAVLVVSAVEGVQAQTRVLMRVLRRLRIPTLLFVNKIDRGGADPRRVLREIADRLHPAAVAMAEVTGAGTRTAAARPYGPGDPAFTDRLVDVLTDNDEALLAAYVADPAVPYPRLRAALAAQTAAGLAHPVLFGSAITGAGVDTLVDALTELLPATDGDADAPASGTVFKVDRGPAGEKIAYLRMHAGTVRVRDRLPYGDGHQGRVTALCTFDGGDTVRRDSVTAGHIGTVWGLAGVRVGDAVGVPPPGGGGHHFAPPTLETVVDPVRPGDRGTLYAALTQLAEQDPLIDVRRDDLRREISVSLYGEVQKEVIGATLAADHGVEVTFRETTTLCVERVAGRGAAAEVIAVAPNPFLATVGLRVEPAPPGAGLVWRLGVELGSMPAAFMTAVEETVAATLRQGLHGWQVVDCAVTLTHSGYWARQSSAHGTFDASMSSTATDFRLLTPLVLADALRLAGTVVCEPVHRYALEIPADTLGAVQQAVARLGGLTRATVQRGTVCLVDGEIPAARVHDLERRLPSLTRGEGVAETAFARHRPVRGTPPSRPRWDNNPLDRRDYLRRVGR